MPSATARAWLSWVAQCQSSKSSRHAAGAAPGPRVELDVAVVGLLVVPASPGESGRQRVVGRRRGAACDQVGRSLEAELGDEARR